MSIEARYPLLLNLLDQAKAQISEEEWESLVKELEVFKFDQGVTYLKEFFDTVANGPDVSLQEMNRVLDESIAGIYEKKGIEPLDFNNEQ